MSLHIAHMLVRELGVGVLSDGPLASPGVFMLLRHRKFVEGCRGGKEQGFSHVNENSKALFPFFSFLLDLFF